MVWDGLQPVSGGLDDHGYHAGSGAGDGGRRVPWCGDDETEEPPACLPTRRFELASQLD